MVKFTIQMYQASALNTWQKLTIIFFGGIPYLELKPSLDNCILGKRVIDLCFDPFII